MEEKKNICFGLFQLQVFTTIINGVGITKDGKHRRHMAFPMKDKGSHKHLHTPLKYAMTSNEYTLHLTNMENKIAYLVNEHKVNYNIKEYDNIMHVVSENLGMVEYF